MRTLRGGWMFGRARSADFDSASCEAAELPVGALSIDRDCADPIQRQIYKGLRDLILRRVLPPGMRLPSTRALAAELVVSRNTVVTAYEQLASEGYVDMRPGARAVIIDLPALSAQKADGDGPFRMDGNLAKGGRLLRHSRPLIQFEGRVGLRPSLPDVKQFPFKTWKRLMTQRFSSSDENLLAYGNTAGLPLLQRAIAKYVQAYRGVRCEPSQIIITNGAQGALDLIARLILREGDLVWMEDPGYHGAQGAFIAAGARLAPLPVSADGWDLASVPHEGVRLIYTTPSCQQPLGQTMLMEQRLTLLEIAQQKNAWIIEDDFDSEYRMSGSSVPAMQGADSNGRTIYIGTFAKTLFPALRIGFMILPKPIGADVVHAMFLAGHFVSLPTQAVLADFIDEGHFARHLRSMRRLYSSRRLRFLELAERHVGRWIEPFESDVGLQITFRLKKDMDDRAIAVLANERKLNVTPLSFHYFGASRCRGFVLGYAALDDRAMSQHLEEFAAVFRSIDT